ncbi:hypothetical protein ACQKM2_20000 [Streptomyces sp. NPDC004126]
MPTRAGSTSSGTQLSPSAATTAVTTSGDSAKQVLPPLENRLNAR